MGTGRCGRPNPREKIWPATLPTFRCTRVTTACPVTTAWWAGCLNATSSWSLRSRASVHCRGTIYIVGGIYIVGEYIYSGDYIYIYACVYTRVYSRRASIKYMEACKHARIRRLAVPYTDRTFTLVATVVEKVFPDLCFNASAISAYAPCIPLESSGSSRVVLRSNAGSCANVVCLRVGNTGCSANVVCLRVVLRANSARPSHMCVYVCVCRWRALCVRVAMCVVMCVRMCVRVACVLRVVCVAMCVRWCCAHVAQGNQDRRERGEVRRGP